jgi:hypothetical protein
MVGTRSFITAIDHPPSHGLLQQNLSSLPNAEKFQNIPDILRDMQYMPGITEDFNIISLTMQE